METASWIIRHKKTGEVIAETFNKKMVARLNTKHYEAIPILQYLVELNAKIKGENKLKTIGEYMEKPRFFKWVVEFEVSENWVADGFEMTDEIALDMLSSKLGYAIEGSELRAKVISSPDARLIAKVQGQ